MAIKTLVKFADYNGHKNVLFVMKPKDVEFRKSLSPDVENIQVIATVDVKKNTFNHEGNQYFVHSDCSVSKNL